MSVDVFLQVRGALGVNRPRKLRLDRLRLMPDAVVAFCIVLKAAVSENGYS